MGRKKLLPLLLGLVFIGFYLLTQTKTIYGGDAGDLVSAAGIFGVPHPPGFPLYTFLAGLLIRFLPFFTPAWRAGLLSSIPSAVSLLFLFLILKKITQNNLVSLTGSLILGFSYLFWLYSIVPEVFSLNNLFSLLLIFILFKWQENPRKLTLLYLFFFVYGLALSHHQIILFLTPAFAYIFWLNKKAFPKKSFYILHSTFYILIGFLLPYLYVFFAARQFPLINWNNPVNFDNLLNLISRQAYGTFRSGNVILETPAERLRNISLFFDFLRLDFSDTGLILALIGAYFLFKSNKKLFNFFLFAFLSTGPLFQFYAAYPTFNSFGLAIFERFLILPEIFLVVFITLGINALSKKIRPLKYLFFIFPLIIFYFNYPKISILKNDFSAENLGRDILNTCQKKSILILASDTPLFNTQYVYYALKERNDLYLFHLAMMTSDYYPEIIKKRFPNFKINNKGTKETFLLNFIKDNVSKYPIYTNFLMPNLEGQFVPEGLLLRYYPQNNPVPVVSKIKKRNQELWSNYHNPRFSSLSKYKNLMLSDIVKVYLTGARETGQSFFSAGEFKEAWFYFEKSAGLEPDSFRSFYDLGKVYLNLKNCQKAKENFLKAEKINKTIPEVYLGLFNTFNDCFKDKKTARFYSSLYEEKRKKYETPIEKL